MAGSSRSQRAQGNGSRRVAAASRTVSVGGHRLKVSNLDKVMYPSTGTTKGDVLDYYARVAEVFIRYAHDRPATRKRWVNGVGTREKPGTVFFQKDLGESAPGWVKRATIQHKDHENEYPLVNDAATLAWLAQIAALEIHVPQWRFGSRGQPQNPDRLVLDLDPGDGIGLPECAEVARAARDILNDMGLPSFPVTSGSKGIHLYAALDGKHNSNQVSDVAHELARALEADHPDLVVSDMKRSLRPGKVFVDWSQNSASKTTVAPYSLRGRIRPTVAAPRTWEELDSPKLAHLEFDEVLRRVEAGHDPLRALASVAADRPHSDRVTARLETYLAKRDAAQTPEPMDDSSDSPATGGGKGARSFVIQEHHARRLHYDFRLEHDGVLVSWAIPKGVPTSRKENHLAVQTEDHPLSYGSFEGTIPEGQYGAGTVTIWDSGHYELEKWRDDEIIVTLQGEKGGGLGAPTRVALIRTSSDGDKKDNWLIHLMKPKRMSATAQSTRVGFIKPMLATLGSRSDVTAEDDWAFEMKWDGIRVIAVVEKPDAGSAKRVRLFTRTARDVTATYPDIAQALGESARITPAVFDGEVVALDGNGKPSFELLQQRMGLSRKRDVANAMAEVPVKYFLFDLVETQPGPVTEKPYSTRRAMLLKSVAESETVRIPPAFEGGVDAAIASSRELELEGVIAKRRDEKYHPGRRSRGWIKIKHHRTQEVVVGGWRPGRGSRSGTIGSLLLGIPTADGLAYVGRVGTGFTEKELGKTASTLSSRERKTSPFVDVPRSDSSDAHWVRPDLVGEVEFAEWTKTGRLRQPVWRGWRPDKAADDVVKE